MPAIAGLPPRDLRDLLDRHGWVTIDETENIWLMVDKSDPKAEPIPIPKHGDVTDPGIMDWVVHHSPAVGRAVLGAVGKHLASQKPTTP